MVELLLSTPDKLLYLIIIKINFFLTTLGINFALFQVVAGVCRSCELTNLKINDVKDTDSYLLVSTPDTKRDIYY